MKKIHAREKEQFKKLLLQEGIKNVEKRFQVLEAFLLTENHVTVEELVSLLDGYPETLDSDFVNDTLKLMVRYGFAEKKQFEGGNILYGHRHIGLHHDHMICTKRRKIIEFTDNHLEQLQDQIACSHGFHMLLHTMEIYGICSDCLKHQANLIPLDMAEPGHKLIIKKYLAGVKATRRLINMGLRFGDKIEGISNAGKGQIVIAVYFNRYVLGRGFACKILVQQEKTG